MQQLPSRVGLWEAICVVATVVFLAWGTACNQTSAPSGIQGQVNDEQAQPIAGATIALAPLGLVTTSARDGSYALQLPNDLPSYATLTFSAPGYAAVSRPVLQVSANMVLLPVELRQAKITQVTLPEAGQPAATVVSQVSDAGVTLSIAAGALVDATGTPAHGNANVQLTYWHPLAPVSSMPTLLMAAQSGNLPVPLQTFGMASVAAEQNGIPLQVASGGNIKLVFQTAAAQIPLINASGAIPNLYVLDTNVGLWVGAAKVGGNQRALGRRDFARDMQWPGYAVQPYNAENVTVVYDPNTGKFETTLPYFAAWNVDGELPTSNGGCVQGKIINACSPGTGFADQDVTLWVLGFEQLRDFHTRTDGQSNYCINIGVSPYQSTHNADPQDTYNYTFNYFIAGGTIDDTSQCDPLPQACHICNDYYESFSSPFCNTCQLAVYGDPPFADPKLTPPIAYSDTCTPPTSQANIHACHFCPGTAPGSCTMPNTFDAQNNLYANGAVYNSCTQLVPVVLRPPSCTCQYRGSTCTNSGCCSGSDGLASTCNGTGTCVGCNKTIGQICSQLDGCCDPAGITKLTCADNVCVPNQDPAFSE